MPLLSLYKFATKAQDAIRMLDNKNIEASLLNLKSLFKFLGIKIIVMFALYFVTIIVMIVGLSFFQSHFIQMSQQGMM